MTLPNFFGPNGPLMNGVPIPLFPFENFVANLSLGTQALVVNANTEQYPEITTVNTIL